MIYLTKRDDTGNFGFKDPELSVITENDVLLSDEIYQQYNEKSFEHQFKLKNINGTTFEEIFEEVPIKFSNVTFPEPVEPEETETSPQELLTQQVANLAIENKKKDVAIQSLVKMVADLNIKVQGGIN